MTVAWPATLPQKPFRGNWSEQEQPNVIRFQPDVGPPIVRRRGTVTTYIATGIFRMTNEQIADFMVFHKEELKGGARRFSWAHPVSGAAATWTFEEAYSYRHVDDDVYDLQVTLRRMP